MNSKEKNTWTTLKSNTVYENAWIKVINNEVLNPKGKPGIYGVVNFKNLAIGVLPLDKDLNTWLVGQWRYPLNKYSWEIPEGGGTLDVNPLESAKRELKEETGLIAKKYTLLCNMHTSNSATNEYCHIYLAQDLEQAQAEPEDSEDLQIRKVPFETVYNMVMNGEITDSLSMVAIFKTKILLEKGFI